MRINKVKISNFKAITDLELEDLGDTIVIAGPNGCGKSCIFDAIRLVKSIYGGYQQNEVQHWFGEFQLNPNQSASGWLPLFQNQDRPLEITVEFALSESERQYFRENSETLLTDQVWREVAPELAAWRYTNSIAIASHLRVHEARVRETVQARLPEFQRAIDQETHTGRLTVAGRDNTPVKVEPSPMLEMMFGLYDPAHLGIIDYHGANRTYAREQVGGISLNIEQSEQRMRQHALYNYSNKYANLKTEMAGAFVRQLLSEKAAPEKEGDRTLVNTLKELFSTFFPGKEFLGPTPTADGRLLFPVRTKKGDHDIDDLSAGEKEVLYGYLRLRNSAPRNSVLLIDEPELHLNPRLVMGLASFYHRHIGTPQGTQLWLVTHSDTFIREAVGQDGFSVFHMQPPGQYEGANQIVPINAAKDVDRLVLELVGDLAAYRPGAKIVVFEGSSDNGFDVRMVGALFPEFQARVNCISGGNRQRVEQLYDLLEQARAATYIPGTFYAVTDADSEVLGPAVPADATPRRYRWDVYHIENYLLSPKHVLKVVQDLAQGEGQTEESILAALRGCAAATVDSLVAHKLRVEINAGLTKDIDFGIDPQRRDVGVALHEAMVRSVDRIDAAAAKVFSENVLTQKETQLRQSFQADLDNGNWLRTFRGRQVLRQFLGDFSIGLNYPAFRDLILARMRDDT